MRGNLADGRGVFVRNREMFAQEPFGISTDEPFTDELTELITRLAIGRFTPRLGNLIVREGRAEFGEEPHGVQSDVS
jgi:hypothetical protein